jgi:hypothetical protein
MLDRHANTGITPKRLSAVLTVKYCTSSLMHELQITGTLCHAISPLAHMHRIAIKSTG